MTQITNFVRSRENSKLGLCFFAILLWIGFENGRPPYTLNIPLVISVLLFLNWLMLSPKKWNPQIICFMVLLTVMLITTPLVVNTYSAFWTTYGLLVTLLFICIPFIHFVDSFRKVDILIKTYALVFFYVALWAIFHGGNGPGGPRGGQDENYTSALMCMAIPLAYIPISFVKGTFKKLVLICALGVFTMAIVVGFSRGGFVGLVVVFLYCLVKSPRRGTAISIGVIAVVVFLIFASEEYLQDMGTITDTKESTADLRLEAWSIAFRMFQSNPIFGVGAGNYIWNATEYQSPEQYEKFGRGLFLLVHSLYFEILSELGSFGVILFTMVLYYNFKDVRFMNKELPAWRERLRKQMGDGSKEFQALFEESEWIRCYANGLMGSMLGFLAAYTFLQGFYKSHLWILTAIIVSLKNVTLARMEAHRNSGSVASRGEIYRKAV